MTRMMDTPTVRFALSLIGLQVGWWACVAGAAHGYPWVGPLFVAGLVCARLAVSRPKARELSLAWTFAMVGFLFDNLLALAGLVRFTGANSAIPPLWMVALWVLLSLAVRESLSWFWDRPALASSLAAVFGPLAYLAGDRIGAVSLNGWPSVILLIAGWAGVFPLLLWIAHQEGLETEGGSPPSAPATRTRSGLLHAGHGTDPGQA